MPYRNATRLSAAAVLVPSLLLAAPQLAEAKPTRISNMPQGTSLKPDPGNKPSRNPACSANARAAARDFKRLGGNSITIVIPLVQQKATSSTITRRGDTASDGCYSAAIKDMRAIGFKKVNIRVDLEFREPLVVRRAGGGTFTSIWRGRIDPNDEVAWFTSYTAQLVRYADLAARAGADGITIGTELDSVVTKANTARWVRIVRFLQARNPELDVRYTATDSGALKIDPVFVRSLDKLGVTVWPRLKYDGKTTPAKVEKAMKPTMRGLDKIAKRVGEDVAVDEIGARSRKGTHKQTADGVKGGTVSLSEQRDLYEGMFRALNKSNDVDEVSTWLTETDPAYARSKTDTGYSAKEPARKVLAKWFGGKA